MQRSLLKLARSTGSWALIAAAAGLLGAGLPRANAPAAEGGGTAGSDTCKACHADRADLFVQSPHGRAFAGKGIADEKACESCHGPGATHAESGGRGNAGFDTIAGPSVDPKRLAANCLTCHANTHPNWSESKHARMGLSCNSCHVVHHKTGSEGPGKRNLAVKTTNEVCMTCHNDKMAHIPRASRMPVGEGKVSCTDCHNPHGTPNDKLLKAAAPSDLCLTCHTEKRGPFLFEHPPVRDSCLNCHDAHGSLHDNMLVEKRPFLCQNCHAFTRHPATLYDNTVLPQQNNRLINRACLNCHTMVHGSNHPSGKYLVR